MTSTKRRNFYRNRDGRFLQGRVAWLAVRFERTRIRLEQDAFPWIGRRPIAEIEPPELLACLRRVEVRGAIETAHRTKDACGQVLRFGIATGKCTRNAAADLRDALRPVQSHHLAAIIDPARAGQVLRDAMAYVGHPVTRGALALSAMLLLRPGELRQMAVAVLVELRPITGGSHYIFPSLLTPLRCMSENTVRAALRRMGYSNDDMTAHGFRAMARTLIAERLGVAPEVIEAQLAHTVPDALGRPTTARSSSSSAAT